MLQQQNKQPFASQLVLQCEAELNCVRGDNKPAGCTRSIFAAVTLTLGPMTLNWTMT